MNTLKNRLTAIGLTTIVVGAAFFVGGGYALAQVNNGADSLQAFSAAQNVTLTYNEDGVLIDRGTTEGAEAIMTLLVDEWGYPVNEADLDPNDPLVNTATEYMYQMATIGYHTLHGTQVVVLDKAAEYNGEVFHAGEHELYVRTVGDRGELGGYWTDFDRKHPIEGPARAQAWTGTAHGLIAELGVGAVTASTLQLAQAIAWLLFGLGAVFVFSGSALVYASKGE